MQRFIVGECRRVSGAVLDDDGLKIVIPGVFVQTCQAAVQVSVVLLWGISTLDFRGGRSARGNLTWNAPGYRAQPGRPPAG